MQTDDAATSLEAGLQIGDFRIETRLGAGGMGIVFRARQISLNRIVALKVIGNPLTRSNDIVRFQREAQAAARLNHPNIASIHFVGQDDQQCYMAMEYIDGISLGRITRCLSASGDPNLRLDSIVRTIEQAEPQAPTVRFDGPTETLGTRPEAASQEYDLGRITPEAEQLAQSGNHIRRCCELICDTAHALAHAHGKSVVHRDIKPENLLLDKDGQVHIIDFGIARFFEDATVTQTGRLVGTPMYMSPEQVTARLDVDHRTDIYSLGLVLYELLALQPAMLAPTREGILRNIVTKALPPVSSKNPAVSQDLEGIVHKATARDPDARYQTAEGFAEDLQDWLNGKTVSAKPYRYEADLTEIEATRPRPILLLSVLILSVALLGLAAGVSAAGYSLVDGTVDTTDVLFTLVVLGIGTAAMTCGCGLLRGYGWARWCLFGVVALLGALSVYWISLAFVWTRFDPFLVVQSFALFLFSIVILVVLLHRTTKQWFHRAKRIRAEHKTAS